MMFRNVTLFQTVNVYVRLTFTDYSTTIGDMIKEISLYMHVDNLSHTRIKEENISSVKSRVSDIREMRPFTFILNSGNMCVCGGGGNLLIHPHSRVRCRRLYLPVMAQSRTPAPRTARS